MKLSELEANLVCTSTGHSFSYVTDGGGANGVLFKCPGCWAKNGGSAGTHMILVWFANPIGGAPVASSEWLPAPRWQRTGETLETLTLHPSVDAKCWHGWVRQGICT